MIRSFWAHFLLMIGTTMLWGCPGGSNINPLGDTSWVNVDVGQPPQSLNIPCTLDSECPSELGGAGGCVLPRCIAGFCAPAPAANKTDCNDNNGCTINDQCNAGACLGAPLICDDEDPCTDDFCDPEQEKCVVTFNAETCDDDNPCTVEDICDEGLCSGDTRVCDDGEICTDDDCDENASDEDACFVTFNEVVCEDGDPCTIDDQCLDAECLGLPNECDDSNSCTANFCDPDLEEGCAFTVISGDCDDGNPCTALSACDHGACVPGNWVYSTPECAQGDCGNNVCDPSESCLSCPYDCGLCCGDGNCNNEFGENCLLCPEDCDSCPTCGDSICESGQGEDCDTCPADCGACGAETVCIPDLPITCGQAEIQALPAEMPIDSPEAGLTNVLNDYSCVDTQGIDYSGPERSYHFTSSCSGLITLKVHRTGGLGRLDIMVLDAQSACTGQSCIASGIMDSDGSVEGFAVVKFKAHKDHPYTVVIDGETGAFGDFKLSSSCACDVPPENCTDNVDNDADDKEDCEDPECVGEAQCGGTEFSCTNNIDDNYDGYTDCDDTACIPLEGEDSHPCADSLCPSAGLPLECGGQSVSGTLVTPTLEDKWTSYECAPGNYLGKEKTYRFTPDCTSTVTINWQRLDQEGPGTIDLILFRGITSCSTLDSHALDCLASAKQGPGGNGSLSFTAYEGVAYTLAFDGTDGAQGSFQIQSLTCECGVIKTETCGNLLDDDDDNLVDCDDPNCDDSLNCEPENCVNGLDDNENYLIDCFDPVCENTGACLDPGDGCTLSLPPHLIPEGNEVFSIVGSTNGASDQLHTQDGVCGAGSSGFGAGTMDRFHLIQVPEDGRYRISLKTLGDSPVFPAPTIAILDECPPAEGYWCLANSNKQQGLLVDLDADYPNSIVVDAGVVGAQGVDYEILIERAEKDCSDGIDDEGDGFIDCGDLDCIDDTQACPLQGDSCESAVLVDQLPYVNYASTKTASSNAFLFTDECPGIPFAVGQLSPDIFYQFTAPDTGTYVFSLSDNVVGGFDTVLFVLDECGGTCLIGDDSSQGEELELQLDEQQTVYVVVDGYQNQPGISGNYQLSIRQRENNCADGIDDNKDGNTDCQDPDCAGTATCPIAGDQCFDAPSIDPNNLPAIYFGDTSNANKDYGFPTGGCPGVAQAKGAGSPDVSLSFIPTQSGFYMFTLAPEFTDFNSLLYAVTDCNDIINSCIAADDFQTGGSSIPPNGREALILGLKAGELIYLIIDGWHSASFVAGSYGLEVEFIGVAEVECNNFIDDDNDGQQDCEDPDCSGVGPSCQDLGQTCNSVFEISSTNTYVLGSTFLGLNNFEANAGECPGLLEDSGNQAPDTKIKFTAPDSAIYRASLDPTATDYDSVIYILDACNESANCLAGGDAPGSGGDQVDFALAAGETVFIIVDGSTSSLALQGDFYLNVNKVSDFESTCDDLTDNDSDGLVDCLDPDCSNAPTCPVPGSSCETPYEINEVPVNLAGSTINADLSAQVSEACAVLDEESGDAGKDIIYRLTAPKSGTYRAALPAGLSNFDPILYVQTGCGLGDSCLASADIAGGAGEDMTFSAVAGEELYIVVDSLTADQQGDYMLTLFFLSVPESICDDGQDNDQDELVDCDDPDCATVEACIE